MEQMRNCQKSIKPCRHRMFTFKSDFVSNLSLHCEHLNVTVMAFGIAFGFDRLSTMAVGWFLAFVIFPAFDVTFGASEILASVTVC